MKRTKRVYEEMTEEDFRVERWQGITVKRKEKKRDENETVQEESSVEVVRMKG